MSDLEALRDLARAAASELERRSGVQLTFGGEGERPTRRPTVPTDARSEFLANRAMGDWAEQLLATALREHFGISHYGSAESVHAGDPGFKEFYLAQLDAVRTQGKRPDLLVFEGQAHCPHSIAELPAPERDRFVAQARASIEVRSSKFRALRYMDAKAERRAEGLKAVGREAPSFTVKVEDLMILFRWIERHGGIEQAYFQVFFDSAFAINVRTIFRLISAWPKGFKLEKPDKSQRKPTVLIPITCGEQVGSMAEPPQFEARVRETALGRLDAYVVPRGGRLHIDRAAAERVLFTQ